MNREIIRSDGLAGEVNGDAGGCAVESRGDRAGHQRSGEAA